MRDKRDQCPLFKGTDDSSTILLAVLTESVDGEAMVAERFERDGQTRYQEYRRPIREVKAEEMNGLLTRTGKSCPVETVRETLSVE